MTNPELPPLDRATRIRRSAGQVHCLLGDVFVLMDSESGEYFELNRVGSRLWQEIAAPASIARLVSALLKDYLVEESVCEEQVQVWIEKMMRLGFIELVVD
jgi:hypothetical protein